jgi:hypothetical protein
MHTHEIKGIKKELKGDMTWIKTKERILGGTK